MLSRIEISNFKAIKETPLVLDGLAPVNYLVGPNGCGKSSVLEILDAMSHCKASNDYNNILVNQDIFMEGFNIKNYSFKQNTKIHISSKEWRDGDKIYNFSLKSYFAGHASLIYETDGSEYEKFACYWCNDFYNTGTIYNDIVFKNPIFETFNESISNDYKTHRVNLSLFDKIIKNNNLYINRSQTIPNEGFNIIKKILKELKIDIDFSTEKMVDDMGNYINYYDVASGKIQIYNILLSLMYLKSSFSTIPRSLFPEETGYFPRFSEYLFLIEEPEKNLHPSFQKLLPIIFNKLLNYFPLAQFIISTHSPFIISAAGEIGDQNVYLIKEGQCLNPQGSKKGGAKRLAMEMLGAGVDDILPKTVVICEGSTKKETKVKEKDAKVLNAIFGNNLDAVFYSNDGCDEVLQSACAVNLRATLNPSIPINTKIVALNDFDTKEQNEVRELRRKKLKGFGVIFKVLGDENSIYKELEDFLFTDKVLDLCDEKYEVKLNRESNEGHRTVFSQKNKIVIKQMLKSEENDCKILIETFQIEILAKLITPETQVYQELHKLIFT
jgi:predicted ATPase